MAYVSRNTSFINKPPIGGFFIASISLFLSLSYLQKPAITLYLIGIPSNFRLDLPNQYFIKDGTYINSAPNKDNYY